MFGEFGIYNESELVDNNITIVNIPVVTNTELEYTGYQIGPDITYDTDTVVLLTSSTEKSLGNYTLIFELKNIHSMRWSDGTLSKKFFKFSINNTSIISSIEGRLINTNDEFIPLNSLTKEFTFNKNIQGYELRYDQEILYIDSTSKISELNSGDYSITFKDKETDEVIHIFSWKINKCIPVASISKNTMDLHSVFLDKTELYFQLKGENWKRVKITEDSSEDINLNTELLEQYPNNYPNDNNVSSLPLFFHDRHLIDSTSINYNGDGDIKIIIKYKSKFRDVYNIFTKDYEEYEQDDFFNDSGLYYNKSDDDISFIGTRNANFIVELEFTEGTNYYAPEINKLYIEINVRVPMRIAYLDTPNRIEYTHLNNFFKSSESRNIIRAGDYFVMKFDEPVNLIGKNGTQMTFKNYYQIYIVGIDHNPEIEGYGRVYLSFARNMYGKTLAFRFDFSSHSTTTNTMLGYYDIPFHTTDLSIYLNNDFYNILPEELRSVMVDKLFYVTNTGFISRKITLPSITEVYGKYSNETTLPGELTYDNPEIEKIYDLFLELTDNYANDYFYQSLIPVAKCYGPANNKNESVAKGFYTDDHNDISFINYEETGNRVNNLGDNTHVYLTRSKISKISYCWLMYGCYAADDWSGSGKIIDHNEFEGMQPIIVLGEENILPSISFDDNFLINKSFSELKNDIINGQASNILDIGSLLEVQVGNLELDGDTVEPDFSLPDSDTNISSFQSQIVRFCVIGINHNPEIEGYNRVHFMLLNDSNGRAITIMGKQIDSHSGFSGTFAESELHQWLNNEFYNALPEDLKNSIINITKYTGTEQSILNGKIFITSIHETSRLNNNGRLEMLYEYFLTHNVPIRSIHSSSEKICKYNYPSWSRDKNGNKFYFDNRGITNFYWPNFYDSSVISNFASYSEEYQRTAFLSDYANKLWGVVPCFVIGEPVFLYYDPNEEVHSISERFSLSELQTMIQEGNISNYFEEGDYFKFRFESTVEIEDNNYIDSSTDYIAFILGINHNSGIEGTNRVHFCITRMYAGNDNRVAFDGRVMNINSNSENNWPNSNLHQWLNNEFYNALPEDFKSVISPCKKYSCYMIEYNTSDLDNAENYSFVEDTCNIFIPGTLEICESTEYENFNRLVGFRQQQYDYFKNGNSFIFNKNDAIYEESTFYMRDRVILNDSRNNQKTKGFHVFNHNALTNNIYHSYISAPDAVLGFLPCFTIA